MKLRNLFLTSACFVLSYASVSYADPLVVGSVNNVVLTSSSNQQIDRLSRSSLPSTFAAPKTYPGTLGNTSTYYYQTYTYSAASFLGNYYLDIFSYSPGNDATYFVSAYLDSYDPNNKGTNYLGDGGYSGNYQTDDGGDFQILLPSGHDLVILINTGGAGAAGLTGLPINFEVDAFSDSMYGDPIIPPTPEPSSIITLGTGLIAVAGMARRRFRSAV